MVQTVHKEQAGGVFVAAGCLAEPASHLTSSPRLVPISSLTLFATLIAATLRG